MKDDPRVEVLLYLLVLAGGVIFALIAFARQPDFVLEDLLLSLGSDMIAVTVVFLIFFVFRKRESREAQELDRSEKDELLQALLDNPRIQAAARDSSDPEAKERYRLKQQFEIADKYFDENATPQEIVVEFRNRGINAIEVNEITFSAYKLPETALSRKYRQARDDKILIPLPDGKQLVQSGDRLPVKIALDQKWKSESINQMAGSWGYLRVYVSQLQDGYLFYSI